MIIRVDHNNRKQIEVGKTYLNIVSDLGGRKHLIGYLVLREATYEEWKIQKPKDTSRRDKSKDKFYEIAMD